MNFKAHVLVFSAVAFFLSNSLLGQRELYANQSQSTSEASQVDSKSTQTQADPEQTPKTSGKSPNEQQPTQTGVGKEAEKKKSDEPGRSTNGKSEKAGKEKTPSRSTTKPVPKKQIRAIELSGNYVDLLEPMQLDAGSLLFGGELQKPKSFFRLCDYLDELGKDELVTHIAFDLSDHLLTMNSAQLDELTRRLAQLKGTGKKTLAWLENASNVQLAIAAACDQIVMADFGGIDMPSTVMESMFYRDAMDLVGIKASVVRAGDFKGAVEPFVNPVMSEHLREHYRELLKSMNDAQVSRIAKGRGLTAAVVRECQRERMLLPKDALAKGLVDQLAPYGSMKETITKIAGAELEWTTPKAKPKREMSFFELMGNIMSGPRRSATRVREDSIAVLHLSGAIVDGKRAIPGSIVSGPSVKTIDELAKDEKIKGVVVRINSPGGSATASEAIRKSLESLANSKPVVFSMGEVAASGGYWVTCIGQPVYAEQGTITGSIGVFAMKISLGSLLRRIGVHIESVTLDDSAAFDSIGREWNDTDSQNLQRLIDDVYDRFLDLASSSRKMPLDKLKGLDRKSVV